MSDIAISIENVSKMYRLGQVGTGTLSHDLKRWWYKARGKEDPYMILGEENKRDAAGGGNYVWALQDINFNVEQGQVLGIIGKNGAGKSTLLKLLSRVTAPTKGEIKAKGRIASLLEVGTGFHPELSGRENIFLNGAILGMTKPEIKRKFDEIVDFSGVAKYIDTPVKRYSSGMYVRLAFAVAAHLESEILIVDEVLAVGDADFQKKCIGKMGDVSRQDGRTILFVSHNMTAVKTLCPKSLLLKNGRTEMSGETDDVIREYFKLNSAGANTELKERTDRLGNQKFRFTDVAFYNERGDMVNEIISGEYLRVRVYADCADDLDPRKIQFGINFCDHYEEIVLAYLSDEMGGFDFDRTKGYFELIIPNIYLRANVYNIKLLAFYENTNDDGMLDIIERATEINILNGDIWHIGRPNRGGKYAIIPGKLQC